MATGRKPVYDTKIKPNLKKIEQWLLYDHMTQNEVIKKLGISKETWYKYCREKNDLIDLIKKYNGHLNEDIEAEYINYSIFGKYVTEETIEYRYEYLPELDKTIEIPFKKTVTKRFVKPDSASGIFTMKNRCNWNDNQKLDVNDLGAFFKTMKLFESEIDE